MAENLRAVVGAVGLALLGGGAVLIALTGGDVASFTDSAVGAARLAIVAVVAVALAAAVIRGL